MRAAIPVVILLAVLSGIFVFKNIANQPKVATAPKEIVNLFAQWKQKHGKLYATPSEEVHRLQIFQNQKSFITKANQDYAKAAFERNGEIISGQMFELNSFADLTETEFTAKYTGETVADETLLEYDEASSLLSGNLGQSLQPTEIRIRNQGACGSCWAFSAVACFETYYRTKTSKYVDFSQQDLVDCNTSTGGCKGGTIGKGLGYILGNSIATLASYPYIAATGVCKAVSRIPKMNFNLQNVAFDLTAAASGIGIARLIGVTVFAGGKFRYLSSDDQIFDASLSGECSNMVTHAINAWGYRSSAFGLSNSWGVNWANKGFKWVKPCSTKNLWGESGSVVYAQ